MKSKEFNAIVRNANREINGTFKSPFIIVNLLNKAAKGDFSKVENCAGLSRENIALVAKQLRAMYGTRYAFSVDMLCKDYKGRFCSVIANNTDKNAIVMHDYFDLSGVSVCVSIDSKGRELCDNGGQLLAPIALTVTAFFNAFAKLAKVEIRDNERAEKELAKQAKAQAKADREKSVVAKVFGELAESMSENEIHEKFMAIKGARTRK